MIKRIALAIILASLVPILQSCGPEESPTGFKNSSDPADNDFIGLPLTKAQELAESRGLKHRVIKEDGKPLPAIKDYRPNRVNFEIELAKVVAVSRG